MRELATDSRRMASVLRVALAAQDAGAITPLRTRLARAGVVVDAGAATLADLDALLQRSLDVLVVVADLASPPTLAALRRARRAGGPRIVVVATGGGTPSPGARQALNAGADAYLTLADVDRTLAVAVNAVAAGLVCAPREARRLLVKPTFSHREKEVLGLLVQGLTNGEIAVRLYLAESTVKSHLLSAFSKLGVRSRADAVAVLLDPAEGLSTVALVLAPGARSNGRPGV